MAVAIVSETGMAIHIPFKAYIRGKISSNGIEEYDLSGQAEENGLRSHT